MKLTATEPRASRQPRLTGVSLVELLVYMTVLLVLLGVGFAALYRCLDNSTALRHATDDVVDALHAGENWRADVRAAAGKVEIENLTDEQIIHLPGIRGDVAYRFADHSITRRLGQNGWSPVLANVRSSLFVADPRGKVAAWRWELELQPRTKQLSRVIPLFTFISVPAGGGSR